MAYLSSLNQVRKIEYARSYSWDVRFPDAPSPFNSWFPAIDYTDSLNISQSFKQNWYLKTYSVPQNSGLPDVMLTYYDDVNNTLANWMTKWHSSIYDDARGLLYLEDAVRPLYIAKLDNKKNVISTKIYYVYPEGTVIESGNSQSDVKQYSAAFTVAGMTKSDSISSAIDNLLGTANSTLNTVNNFINNFRR